MRFLPGNSLRKVVATGLAVGSVFITLTLLQPSGYGDIQDPPSNLHGPIRKLSRGLANIAFSASELFAWMDLENDSSGNNTLLGPVRGVSRCLTRIGVGFYDVFTFPAPTWMGSYAPVEGSLFRSSVPWVNGGFEEFPPELGFETRMPYSRIHSASTRLP